jgi:REP element-mobilizing transposase RayT
MTPYRQRKSPRLQGYDYSQSGAYFVTICTHNRAHLFGEITEGAMMLNDAGAIAQERWLALPDHHPNVELDAFVVMPNHVHGIVILVGTGPALSVATDNAGVVTDNAGVVPTLGTVIGSYKSGVTRRIREAQNDPDLRVWQSRYHDHIIRTETALNHIREYIMYNPARWREDAFYGDLRGKLAL